MAVLIIAEKPNAAEKIAFALGNPKKHGKKAVWFELERNGERVYVVPSVGHIFSLKQKGKGWNYPTFETEWVPSFSASKSSAFTEAYYTNLEKIAKRCDRVVIATDFDTEGSVIGFNILRFICGRDDAKRMRFSTLTADELREAYENAGPLDVPQIEAGLARHELDWLWGINASRALTKAVNVGGKGFTVMSTGRVQGPALKLLVDRECEIRAFAAEPFWQLEADAETADGILTTYYEKDKIWDKPEAVRIKESCGDNARVVALQKRQYEQAPPVPFDLTSLQIEAHGVFGFSPSATLELAQTLYEQGLISYPRTSSQKLPEKLGLGKILSALAESTIYKKLVASLPRPLVPNEGKKSDAAHPAIHPTGEKPAALTQQQRKLYDLIVRRFLATFARASTRETVRAMFDINGFTFAAEGSRTTDAQWIEIYKYANFKDVTLPELRKGQMLVVKEVRLLDKETQPPKRYTEAALVRELEKRNLGTKSTRAEIIKTLYQRSYIKDKSIVVTDLGIGVVDALEKYAPTILSEEMTRRFEGGMEAITEGKNTKEKIIEDAKNALGTILTVFKNNEEKIGAELETTLIETRRRAATVGPCPKCGANLRVITAKASKKRFIGCTGYPACATAYPLPQFGLVKTGAEKCKTCGLPIVLIISKGKRPWKLCIDPKCPSKAEWGKKKTEESKA
ncbi:MAG: DNA topoisomerase I [Candidatus Aenigmarchaeota archaeon]|nr:DNA topoisomerase I [Candidatus Aenigmarchaeota archaeon]